MLLQQVIRQQVVRACSLGTGGEQVRDTPCSSSSSTGILPEVMMLRASVSPGASSHPRG